MRCVHTLPTSHNIYYKPSNRVGSTSLSSDIQKLTEPDSKPACRNANQAKAKRTRSRHSLSLSRTHGRCHLELAILNKSSTYVGSSFAPCPASVLIPIISIVVAPPLAKSSFACTSTVVSDDTIIPPNACALNMAAVLGSLDLLSEKDGCSTRPLTEPASFLSFGDGSLRWVLRATLGNENDHFIDGRLGL